MVLRRHLCSPWPAGPPHPGPEPPLVHLLPPCLPCTSPAFLWCLEHARTLRPQGLCTCCSPNRSAFLNLHGIEPGDSSGPQFKCRLVRKAFHAHPACAVACPFPCPGPPSLCSLAPSVFLPSISLTENYFICFSVACLLPLTSLIKYKPLVMKTA